MASSTPSCFETFRGLDSGTNSIASSPPHFQSTNRAFREENCQIDSRGLVKILPTIPAPRRTGPHGLLSYEDLVKSCEDSLHELCLLKSRVMKQLKVPFGMTETVRKFGSDDRLRTQNPMDQMWTRLEEERESLVGLARTYSAMSHLQEPLEKLNSSLKELNLARNRQLQLDCMKKPVGRTLPANQELRECHDMLCGAFIQVTEALKRINKLLWWLRN